MQVQSLKTLLVLFHSQSGNTIQLAEAVVTGARMEPDVEVVVKRSFDAGIKDLAGADGVLIGTPENFGLPSGGVKDFLDRTFYPAQELGINLPYALFISAGNDGTGAVRQLDKLLAAYPMKPVADPIICVGPATDQVLDNCKEMGQAMAAGLSLGIF